MAIVLLATGAFLFVRVGNSLDHNVQEALETRSAELGTDLREGISISTSVLPDDQDEQFAQVVGTDGRVIDATSRVRNRSLLTPAEIDRAVGGRGPLFATIDQAPGVNGHARLFARQVNTAQGTAVLVTGMSLEERQATVRRLLAELLVIGPAALLVASLLGYWVASAALRPVESMRAEAAEISAEAPGRRLSLPASRDELRRLGETLNSTLERLEAALRLERTFVADASHEMRSPIARLKAELELALRRRRTAGELEGTVRSALAEAELLARLSENLLFLARSDHGNLPPPSRRFGSLTVRHGGGPVPARGGAGRTHDRDRGRRGRRAGGRFVLSRAGALERRRELAAPRRRDGHAARCRGCREAGAPRARPGTRVL